MIELYGICAAPTTLRLQQLVNEMIQQGWIPQGGICIAPIRQIYHNSISPEYLQAMIRPKDHELKSKEVRFEVSDDN